MTSHNKSSTALSYALMTLVVAAALGSGSAVHAAPLHVQRQDTGDCLHNS
jgi:hypothetical protein